MAGQHTTTSEGRVSWRPDPANETSIWAAWVNAPEHYTLHWGDGTSQHLPSWSAPVRHTYSEYGRYQLRTIGDTTGTETTEWVHLLQPGPVVFEGDTLAACVGLSGSAPAGGQYTVIWPSWPESETVHLTPGKRVCAPALPGTRTLTVVENDTGIETTGHVQVTDELSALVEFSATTRGPVVTVHLTGSGEPEEDPNRVWWVCWGDEWDGAQVRGCEQLGTGPTARAEHTYTHPGRYFIEVYSNPGHGTTHYTYMHVKQIEVLS